MIVVIQCAASKRSQAGAFRSDDRREILFVANPSLAPYSGRFTHARPDDSASGNETWRDRLSTYNESGGNPFNLLRAYELYENPVYPELVRKFGIVNVYILSAGWGLIAADFLTPLYDITFSNSVRKDAPWKLRRNGDRYKDYRRLAPEDDEVVFLGGKDYISLFLDLTQEVRGERKIFYNSNIAPNATSCRLERFVTRTKTNWHYECARWLCSTR